MLKVILYIYLVTYSDAGNNQPPTPIVTINSSSYENYGACLLAKKHLNEKFLINEGSMECISAISGIAASGE